MFIPAWLLAIAIFCFLYLVMKVLSFKRRVRRLKRIVFKLEGIDEKMEKERDDSSGGDVEGHD